MNQQPNIEKLGRYKILGILGQGAMGIVYKAIDERIERVVAIKTLQAGADLPEDRIAEFRERFFHEAQYAGKLNHPAIVTIFDVEEVDGISYIAMEYVDGKTLEHVIDNEPELPVSRMIEIMIEICDGLSYAHKNGVVHRDIKPSNIILTNDGHAKITDFGIAKVSTSNNTVVGTILGTPGYMSPEQITGKSVDHRTDIFSLGAVFYEFLTQHKAFPGTNLTEILYRVMNENPPPVSVVNPMVPPVFDNIISRALRRNAEERYRSVDFFVQDIQRVELTLTMTGSGGMSALTDDTAKMVLPSLFKKIGISLDYKKLTMGLSVYSGMLTFILFFMLIFGSHTNRLADSLTAQKPAALAVALNVPDAEVSIDGQVIRTTKNIIKIDSVGVGEHRLVVKRDFYETYETVLVFSTGESKKVDVHLKLSPVEIPPGVDTSFITITSNPKMAKVETSTGLFIGYTPIEKFPFPGGNYTLLFSKEDYSSKTRNVVFRRYRNYPVEMTLDKLRGFVSLERVYPEDAGLIWHGKRLQKNLRTNRFSVEVGDQSVTISADGYEDVTKQLFLKFDETIELGDSLKATYGSLLVQSNPGGADIFLDDSEKSVGKSPVQLDLLLASTHKISATYKNEKRNKTIKVEKNDTITTTFVFSNPNGFLELNSDPPGAYIYINTALRRGVTTPQTIEIQPGFHKIRLTHPKFSKFYELTVRVRPENSTKIEHKFE
ncbi:serine/threonine protein kinase [bacterium]|nr:serine/threonine protein kinase [bacterium]